MRSLAASPAGIPGARAPGVPPPRPVLAAAAACLVLTAAACSPDAALPLAEEAAHGHEDYAEHTATRATWSRYFQEDGDGDWVSAVLASDDDIDRAGFLLWLDPEARGREIPLFARALLEGAASEGAPSRAADPAASLFPGPWLAATYTFSEGELRVARADFAHAARGIQVRVRAADAPWVRALTYAAVARHDTPGTSPSLGSEGADVVLAPSTRVQPLLEGVMPRSAWGARDTRCSTSDVDKGRVSIHHTVSAADGAPDFESRLRALQAFHMDVRDWCDLGYHMVVTLDGTGWEGRSADFLGAHVGGYNTGNFGMALMGCFESGDDCRPFPPSEPPDDLLEGVATFVAAASTRYGFAIGSDTVLGHRDNPEQATACPGSEVWRRLPDIRARALEMQSAVLEDAGVDAGPPGDAGDDGGLAPPPITGRVQGVVWDLSKTNDAGQAASIGARVDTAEVSCSCGVTVSVRQNDAYWVMDVEPGQHTFTARAPGFAPTSRVLRVGEDDLVWASLGIAPEDVAASVVVVISEARSGDPIRGARVEVVGGAIEESDENGRVRFDLTAGRLTLAASKPGYRSGEREVVLQAGDLLRIGIQLERLAGGGVVLADGGLADPWSEPGEDGGCSCRASGGDARLGAWGALGAALFVLGAGRRRRR